MGITMTIDMDKTISKLLLKYYKYIDMLIEREKQNVMKIKDNAVFENEKAKYLKLIEAEKFFKLIVVNPEKYLYRPLDIVYIKIDEKNRPVDFYALNQDGVQNLPSICDKLKPIRELINKHQSRNILDILSSYISYHVKAKGVQNPWLYNGNKMSDYKAHYILELNKYVNLLLYSGLKKALKNKIPVNCFAEKRTR